MNFFMPVRLFTGENCVARYGETFSPFGKRCAVITGRHAAVQSGALADAAAVLDAFGIVYEVFPGIGQNPSVASCRDAGQFAWEMHADFILGIGGGSALDAAKAAAVFATNPELDEVGFYGKAWENDPLPIFLIGTTAGTGSEVTKVSVLTDSFGKKHSIHDDRLYAKAAFGDSRYTHSLPRTVTLTTGVDVLAHCAESYFSRKADEISRAFSIRGIRLLCPALSAAAEGETLTELQRKQLYEASILGGLAINTTGTCFPHNVGYYLTERYGIPHGFACAVFLQELLELAGEADHAYAERFFSELEMDREALQALAGKCLPEMTVAMTEEEIEAVLPRWEKNGSVANTRAEITTDRIRDILKSKFIRS